MSSQNQQSSNVANTANTQMTQQAGQAHQGQNASFHPSQELAQGPQSRVAHQAHQLDPSQLAMTYASSENSGKAVAAMVVADQIHQLLEMELHTTKVVEDAIDELSEYGTWNPEDDPEEWWEEWDEGGEHDEWEEWEDWEEEEEEDQDLES